MFIANVYPNPVNSLLNINIEAYNNLPNHYNISILDVLGRAIWNNQTNNININFDTNELNKGIYLIEIKDKYDNKFISKFIKI